MSAKIDVLLVGYARGLNSDEKLPSPVSSTSNLLPQLGSTCQVMKACGSCCLVRSSGEYILFDTMGPWEKDLLLEKLASLKIHPDDIKYVVCSHGHPDHCGNLNLFMKANLQLVGTQVFSNDLYRLEFFKMLPPWIDADKTYPRFDFCQLNSNSRLEVTPGHTLDDITLIVNNVDGRGIVAMTGDLFEREEDLVDESIWLEAGSQNPDYQRFHRGRILKSEVEYIIPGHGDIFKNPTTSES